jgi:hypothetical protein
VSRRHLAALVGVLLLGAALRFGYAWGADGLFHADDIHQSLEPAHGVVYGTGLRFPEFDRGARPWTVPGVYVALLWLLELLGVTRPEGYTLAARLLDAAIAATWPWLAYRLARACHSPRAGLAAAWLTATWYLLVLLAPRALSHTFSTTFALWATARAAESLAAPALARRHQIVTGVLLGLAFAFRYQEGLVAAGVALFLAVEGRPRALVYLAAGALGPVLGVAALDWATWGAPFHSLFAYVDTNLFQGYAVFFGRMPWHFYLGRLAVLLGAGAAVLIALPWAGRRALVLLATVAGPVLLVHSLIGHKEVRFVLTAIVILLVAAGCGAAGVLTHGVHRGGAVRTATVALVTLLLGGFAAASALRGATLTFADLGIYERLPEGRASPWSFRRDCNRALARVGRRHDLCGVAVFPFGPAEGAHRLGSTGGYTYLNRAVPLVVGRPPPRVRPFVNYVVSCPGADAPAPRFDDLEVAEQVGVCTVYRRREAVACPPAALAPFAREWRWAR